MWIRVNRDSIVNANNIIEIRRMNFFGGNYEIQFCHEGGITSNSYDTEDERDRAYDYIVKQLNKHYNK